VIIYSCYASGIESIATVAAQFAREYWAQPREICAWDAAAGTFQVVDGTRVYRVVYDPGKRFERAAVYHVEVEES
jgi:hypothetical protein